MSRNNTEQSFEVLKAENQRLQAENEHLMERVAQLTQQLQQSRPGGTDVTSQAVERELALHKLGLKGDIVVDEHNELLELRKRTRVYERALDETEENLRQLKALYHQLQ